MDIKLSHAVLANCSLAYFHHAVQSAAGDLWVYYSLARYGGHFWNEHQELSQGSWQYVGLKSIILDLFDEGGPYFTLWAKVANVDRLWPQDALRATPMTVQRYITLPTVVSHMR